MTVSYALAILEAATLGVTKETSLREELDFLQPRIRPEWLIPQFCYHAQLNDKNEVDVDKEAQQQAFRRIFPRIHGLVKNPHRSLLL